MHVECEGRVSTHIVRRDGSTGYRCGEVAAFVVVVGAASKGTCARHLGESVTELLADADESHARVMPL